MKQTLDKKIFNVIGYICVSFVALMAFLPFMILVSSSLQSETTIITKGFSLFPRELSGSAYKTIFEYPKKIINSYLVTIFVTGTSTTFSIFFSSMAAYVLYRKNVKYRAKLAFFIYFTTLFNGGLVPYYVLIVKYLGLKNSLLALMVTGLFNVFYIIVIRSYMTGSIPDSLPESAKIDGANDFRIFISLVLPLSKPVIAAILLFIGLNYWNDWWSAMMFIEKQNKMPLQYVLYRLISKANFMAQLVSEGIGSGADNQDMPKETLKLAMTVVAIGPIVLLYPFLQKHFVKGITIGAVKG